MNKIKLTAILLFLFLAVDKAQAQKADSILAALARNSPEKLYLHYDKEYYVAGETIWFKAYFYRDGKPSGLSNNLYLQFVNTKGEVIASGKYAVYGAVSKGSLVIPDSLPQGNYFIRAATPAMLAWGESMVYKKDVFVFHPGTRETGPADPSTLALQFFPESGKMVDGILTVVAFKATDQRGIPANVEGIIKTDDGTTIASFHSIHDGIGRVPFKPQAGKKYIAEVETPSGKRTFNLPDVEPSGINLKVQDEKGGKKFQLSRSEKDKMQFSELTVLAEINNHIVYETQVAFENYPSIIGHLVTDSLPSGILHFTVLNADGIPLAERLTFIDNGEYRSHSSLSTPLVNTDKRALNTIQLDFDQAMQSSCSVAVIDMPSFSFNDEDNIVSRFLLTSDLKGHINNPAYYFSSRADSVVLALDNLMLTHGWSRYNWTKLLAGEMPSASFSDRAFINLSGVVVDEKTKTPLAGGKLNIYFEAQDSTTLTLTPPVGADGRFHIDSLYYSGKGSFLYSYTDKNNKIRPGVIVLDENTAEKEMDMPGGFVPPYAYNGNAGANRNEIDKREAFLKEGAAVKELPNVNIESKSNKKPIDEVNEKYTTGLFKEMGKVNLDNINEPVNDKSMDVVDYIKNRIQQVDLQGGNFVNRKNMSLMTGQKWLIGIFVNEQPVNMSYLRTIRAKDVAMVKFYDAGWVGVGSSTPGGALAIYTKEKNTEAPRPDDLLSFYYKGYSISRQFYTPDYAAHPVIAAPDNRTTLYWNPDVITDNNTKSVTLNFYNNDFSKQFKVVVEGFDASGKLVHVEKMITR